MILAFDDACWSRPNDDWNRTLTELLISVKGQEQHALLAAPTAMLSWCDQYLHLYKDYFRSRLSAAQPRANALTIQISPTGAPTVNTSPPWKLDAKAALDIVKKPLELVLENDSSDLLFISASLRAFSRWQSQGWIAPIMGGGSAMTAKINTVSADHAKPWRTFFLFDSDRLHPNELTSSWTPPSGDGCQGYNFEVACALLPPRRWHRLERRSIENYLPPAVLSPIDPVLTTTLYGPSVGQMAHYFNMKKGLDGDRLASNGVPNHVRWARSQGFWSNLPSTEYTPLQGGFGSKVSSNFSNVPANHPWPLDVIAEIDALADALQDAM